MLHLISSVYLESLSLVRTNRHGMAQHKIQKNERFTIGVAGIEESGLIPNYNGLL